MLPHDGTKAQGIERIKKLVEEHRERITQAASELREEWQDNVLSFAFSARGQRIEGTLTVLDGGYELYAKLPLALRLFEGRIERMIEEEARKMRV